MMIALFHANWEAEDIEVSKRRERCQKPAEQQRTTDDDEQTRGEDLQSRLPTGCRSGTRRQCWPAGQTCQYSLP